MEQNTQKQTDNQQIKMNSNSNPNYPIKNFNEKPSTQTGIVLNYQINQNINSILGNNQNPQNSTIPPKNINQEIRENLQLNNNQINNIKNMNNMNNMNIQMNSQYQQINSQIIPKVNQDATINGYLMNCRPPQPHLTQEQIFQQQELRENKNIYDYFTDKNLYGIAFQNGNFPRLAISSLEKSLNNKIEVLELINNELKKVQEQQLDYPCTKLQWSPNINKSFTLAASSDCIKLYNYIEDKHDLMLHHKLANKKSKYCGPLTSFDWNTVNDSLLGTASVDTTCTIWDLNKLSIKTQLIAHDKEVFDIQFGNDENTFISGGADGSVRLFDLRSLNHSTIIYETKGSSPINKLALNLRTSNLIAALSLDTNIIYIFDSRANSNVCLDELKLHKDPVTGIVWAPDNPTQLCSVSEDNTVIISYVHNEQTLPNTNVSYTAPFPINNVDWCKSFPEWIGITFKNKVQLLRK
jgi:WD repeat-containing protein 68